MVEFVRLLIAAEEWRQNSPRLYGESFFWPTLKHRLTNISREQSNGGWLNNPRWLLTVDSRTEHRWTKEKRKPFERNRKETIVLFAVSCINVRHTTNTNRTAFVHCHISRFSFQLVSPYNLFLYFILPVILIFTHSLTFTLIFDGCILFLAFKRRSRVKPVRSRSLPSNLMVSQPFYSIFYVIAVRYTLDVTCAHEESGKREPTR